jgi:hypothetical protein
MKANTPSTDNPDYCDIDGAILSAVGLIRAGWPRPVAIEYTCGNYNVDSPCLHLVETGISTILQGNITRTKI